MGTTFKYSDAELQELVRKGLSQAEIARQLRVSQGLRLCAAQETERGHCEGRHAFQGRRSRQKGAKQRRSAQKINNSVHKVLEEAEAAQLLNARQLREVVSCIESYLPEGEGDAKDAKAALQTLYKLALDACPKRACD